VTKSVTLEPRRGNPAPRVTEFGAGMLNSIGLANPGVEAVRTAKLPWLAANLRRAQVFVSLAGHTPDEYPALVERLDDRDGFLGFELNLSCPNDARRGGLPFALDPEALVQVVTACRARTERPLLAKLAPNDPHLPASATRARDAGADGLTLVNTFPGLVLRADDGTPLLGAGTGGVSGPALRPVGVHAVAAVRAVLDVPLVGVGGVGTEEDARQYIKAGASLVQIGTAALADPRAPGRVARALTRDLDRGEAA
jgi:dihydroorotate dehydrogenase (NAD+) catalytic subunit